MVFIFLLILLFIVFLTLRFSLFIPATNGLPILLYHKVSISQKDNLTITTEQLEQHLAYLQRLDYQSITSQELINFIEKNSLLPEKPVLLAFDDGYINNLELAYPLLQKYQTKATIFLPTAYIGLTSKWDIDDQPIMSVEQLKQLDPQLIEFALHSHTHRNFKHSMIEEMRTEILENRQFLKDNNLSFSDAFAYPYGGRPKDKGQLAAMKKMMTDIGLKLAFRIGNRVNKFPFGDRYEIKRIDIRGTDSFWEFKTKLKKGRIKQL